MSRRVLTPRPAAAARAGQRMAPGGRLWSESPIRPFSRPIGEAGDEVESGPVSVTLRPTSLAGFLPSSATTPGSSTALTLVGGAGNATMSDSSDGTYARMTAGYPRVYVGSVRATFETPTLGWDPTAATLTCRVRALVDTHPPAPADPGSVYWEFKSAAGTLLARSSDYPPNTRWYPTSDWVDRPSDSWMPQIPSAADIAAGVRLEISAYSWPFDPPSSLQLDVSDVALLLEGTA